MTMTTPRVDDATRIAVASALLLRWSGTITDAAELLGECDAPLLAAHEAELVRLDALRAILTGHIAGDAT